MSTVSNVSFHEHSNKPKIVNDVADVGIKYAAEKPYGFAKAIYVLLVDLPESLGWLSEGNPTASHVKHHATLFKLSRSPVLFLDAVNTTVRSAWSYLTGNPIVVGKGKKVAVEPLSQVVRNAAGMVSPVYEMATFFTKAILFIPKASIELLKGINGVALTFLMTWNVFESLSVLGSDRVSDLTDEERIVIRERQNVGAVLKLAVSVSYLALGVLTTLTVFASVSVDLLVMIALSASAVVFTILEFYHMHLGQEKKIT